MEVKKWIKGGPITTLGNGSVNVVEFWATWCGPCRQTIPHLTELATKYQGKVTFSGISVFEDPQAKDESYLKKVKSFVDEMGSTMNYNVGADGLTAPMANKWMLASGQEGIPTAFVIDRQGIVAWIGHPMEGLDEALQQIVDGTYDLKASITKAEAQSKEAENKAKAAAQLQKDAIPLANAMQRKDIPVAVLEIEKLIAHHPEAAPELAIAKFNILLHFDEAKAYAYARELASGMLKDNGDALNTIAWAIVMDQVDLKHPDYATAVVVSKRAVEANQNKDPLSLDTYAYALFKSGAKSEALLVCQKALDLAKAQPDRYGDSLNEIANRLVYMKKHQ